MLLQDMNVKSYRPKLILNGVISSDKMTGFQGYTTFQSWIPKTRHFIDKVAIGR